MLVAFQNSNQLCILTQILAAPSPKLAIFLDFLHLYLKVTKFSFLAILFFVCHGFVARFFARVPSILLCCLKELVLSYQLLGWFHFTIPIPFQLHYFNKFIVHVF